MSDLFFHHPYKYDGSDTASANNHSGSDGTDGTDEYLLASDVDDSISEKSEPQKRSKKEERKRRRKSTKKKKSRMRDEKVNLNHPTDTDVESNGEDDSCVAMSIHFISVIKKTIEEEDADALKETLKKTPLAVVLHYLHYLFHLVNHDEDMFEIVKYYNDRYNIVSKYFLKALQNPDKTPRVMKSLVRVSDSLKNKVELDEIDDLLHFTPEFIVMVTIQSGNMVSHDKIIDEWELSPRFMKVRDLIAAFFGIKKYFSNPERFVERRDLIISAICGGSVKTISKIVRKTSNKYLTEYTLRKTRAICIPNLATVEYLQEKHGLEFT